MDYSCIKEVLHSVPGSPTIIASGAMVIRGILSDASDLDLIVTLEEFRIISEMSGSRIILKRFGPCVQVGDIEASTYAGLKDAGRMISWDMIDGMRVQSVESLKDLYLSLNRPKDQIKLRLLGL